MNTSLESQPVILPHTSESVVVAASLETDIASGLTTAQVDERLRLHGPNRLAESKRVRRFFGSSTSFETC